VSKVATLLVALLSLVGFLACGGGGSSSSAPVAPTVSSQPANQTVLEGATASFAVTAAGTAPLSYQWKKGGTAIPGAASATYTTPATTLADSGTSFTVTVTNTAGSITSNAATLTVHPNPAITAFSANPTTITAGTSATLSFTFTGGTGTVDHGVGTVTSGTPVTVTPATTTTYTLTVDNGFGTIRTASATVTVAPVPVTPSITAPGTVTATNGGLTASVTAQAGMTYAWTITNGTITAGATTPQVTFTAGAVGTTTLTCTATNAAGASAPAGTFTVTVVAAPTITSFTASSTSPLYGGTVTLTPVFSNGNGVIDHSIAASAVTGTAYPTPALTTATTYTLTVTNAAGDTATRQVVVTPQTVLVAAISPASPTVTVNDAVAFSSSVSGAVNTGITWTASSGTISATGAWTAPAAAGTATITATSVADATKSASTTVTVAPAPVTPTITAPAAVTTAKTGLTASVSPQANMTYGWSITNGTITAGATTTQITFTAGAVGSTTVTCTVTNAALVSAPAATKTVTVVAAPVAASLTASTTTPLYGGTVTLTPVFSSASSATLGSTGIGSTDITATAASSNTYTTPSLTSAKTYTLSVYNLAGDVATKSVSVTPQTVTVGTILGPQTLTASTSSSYSAAVGGAVNTGLTWFVDDIPGGNSAVGLITSAGLYTAPAAAGSHTLKAVAAADGSTQATLAVTIVPPPDATITAPSSVASGATGLTASVPSQAPGTIYDWSITNGTGSGTITSSPTSNTVTFSAGSVGTFTLNCAVTNPATTTAFGHAIVTVVAAPVINTFTANPAGVLSGGAVTLSFTFAGGNGAIDNGVGAVSSGVNVIVHPVASTTYTLTVTPTVGSPVTQTAAVTVSTPLSFATNLPTTSSVNVGANITFTVAVTGTPAANTFTWYHNGTFAATTSTGSYTVTNAASADGGTWYVVAGNGITTVTSATTTLTVNTGYGISGHIYLTNTGGGMPVPNATVTLSGASSATTTTDATGAYSFSGLLNGSYTVTPSIVSSGVSAWFLPGSQSLTMSGGNLTADFQADIGFSVSGTVSYSGSKTGRVYLVLSGGNNGAANGVSIAGPTGSFTIRGVPPGSYTLTAFMDVLGLGNPNASDPVNSATIPLSVSSSPVTGVNVVLVDPSPVTLTAAPSFQGIVPFNGGALVNYAPLMSSGVETATSYDLQWSTTSSFTTVAGTLSFTAQSDKNPMCFTSGMTDGTPYYFRIRGKVGVSAGPWSTVSSAVTIGSATGYNTVSGTITLPVSPTGPLAIALVNDTAKQFHILSIPTPTQTQAYTITGVPNGTYQLYAILDQNHNGVIDPGDVSNTEQNGGAVITVAGNLTGQNLAVPGASSVTGLSTQHWKQATGSFTGEGYNLNFRVNGNVKLPVNVALQLGPNGLVDVGVNNGGDRYQYWLPSLRPGVGDSYTVSVAYSDSTTDTQTPAVTAVLDAFAQNLQPTTGTSTSTQPTFSWTAPATPPAYYTYDLWIGPQMGGQLWSYWGMPSTQLSVGYNADGTASQPTLTLGTTYNWSLGVTDAAGNSAQMQVEYKP
jgi:hypothetical protein